MVVWDRTDGLVVAVADADLHLEGLSFLVGVTQAFNVFLAFGLVLGVKYALRRLVLDIFGTLSSARFTLLLVLVDHDRWLLVFILLI